MTETTCAGMHVPGGAIDDSGSTGLLDPNTEGRLVDDEGNEVTALGVPGELFVRGPQMCMGYWRNEVATRETLHDGWLRTGDVAKVDARGWFWIVDRKKVRSICTLSVLRRLRPCLLFLLSEDKPPLAE